MLGNVRRCRVKHEVSADLKRYTVILEYVSKYIVMFVKCKDILVIISY